MHPRNRIILAGIQADKLGRMNPNSAVGSSVERWVQALHSGANGPLPLSGYEVYVQGSMLNVRKN